MTASSKPFPHPLQLGTLDHFCHPVEGHSFDRPMWHQGEVLTANSYIAIRFTRGLWMHSDFELADLPFLHRFDSLPWGRFNSIPDEWQPLDDIRGILYKHAPLSPWDDRGRCAPSRVVRVGATFLTRLSHLQLIARLPRCEIHLGVMGPDAPLLFRFTGGRGMIAADKRLTEIGFSIFMPKVSYDGHLVKRPKTSAPSFSLPGWPPAEPID